jgi:DnaJ-class molecular chaperone
MSTPSRKYGRDAIKPRERRDAIRDGERCERCDGWGCYTYAYAGLVEPTHLTCPACAGMGRRRPAPEAGPAAGGPRP